MHTALTRRARDLVPRDVTFCLLAFLVGRLAVSVLAAVGWQLPHEQPEPATHWDAEPPAHAVYAAVTGLERYDAQWYLQIADDGYQAGDPSSAFFPLFPLLTRGVGWLAGGHPLLGAYLVSNASLGVALVLLYRLAQRELSERVARASVVLLLANPLAFFLYAPYSESLFLALCLLCLTALRQRLWWTAGLVAAAASSTRSTGVALGAAIAVQALADVGWRPSGREAWRTLARTLPVSAAAGAGVVAYLAYWERLSSWREPLDVQGDAFQREPSWPWVSLADGVRIAGQTLRDPAWLNTNIEVGLVLFSLALGVIALRRLPAAYGAFVAVSLILPLCLVRPFTPLTSVPRYYLVVFPLTWALAEVTRRPAARVTVLAAFLPLQVLLVLLFASWHDVL